MQSERSGLSQRSANNGDVELVPLMTAREVAELLRVPVKTVLNLSRRGDLPRLKIGDKTVRFDRADVLEYLIKRKAASVVGKETQPDVQQSTAG